MQDSPPCPLCHSSRWKIIGQRVYSVADSPQLSKYQQTRYDVLFQVWLPGRESVQLTSAVCEGCGFVTYLPRPEAVDVDRKYRYLNEHSRDYGKSETEEVAEARSAGLYRDLQDNLPPSAVILDFGGGDGRLMKHFANAGHRCLVVDYNDAPKAYVEKIANTLDSVPQDLRADAIICSHVLEHVADPVGELRGLAARLKPHGILFVEVPLEIWKKAPLHTEPVTHVNFFCRSSLTRAMQEAGLSVASCVYAGSLHPAGRINPAIRALGRLGGANISLPRGTQEVSALLHPGLFQKLWRRWYLARGKWNRN